MKWFWPVDVLVVLILAIYLFLFLFLLACCCCWNMAFGYDGNRNGRIYLVIQCTHQKCFFFLCNFISLSFYRQLFLWARSFVIILAKKKTAMCADECTLIETKICIHNHGAYVISVASYSLYNNSLYFFFSSSSSMRNALLFVLIHVWYSFWWYALRINNGSHGILM